MRWRVERDEGEMSEKATMGLTECFVFLDFRLAKSKNASPRPVLIEIAVAVQLQE